MKKLIIGLILLGFASPVFAGELEEKQLQLRAVEWEFRYCQQRLVVLQQTAKQLQQDIQRLKKPAKEKETE